jgi:hypothetical protein
MQIALLVRLQLQHVIDAAQVAISDLAHSRGR